LIIEEKLRKEEELQRGRAERLEGYTDNINMGVVAIRRPGRFSFVKVKIKY
jgi:hypothetical protein